MLRTPPAGRRLNHLLLAENMSQAAVAHAAELLAARRVF
jgi:hypothetical protein